MIQWSEGGVNESVDEEEVKRYKGIQRRDTINMGGRTRMILATTLT